MGTPKTEQTAIGLLGILALTLSIAPLVTVIGASVSPSPFFTFPPGSPSLQAYESVLGSSDWRSSISLSLTIVALTAVLATPIGTVAGIAVARSAPKVRPWLYAVVISPLIIPVIVLGISYYSVALEFRLTGSLFAFVLATTMTTTPIVTLLVTAAALDVDERVEYAALSCGAGFVRTLGTVTVPLVTPTALAGGALATLLALDEVTISLFLIAPGRIPLAVQMFSEIQRGSATTVAAVAALMVAVAIGILGLLALFARRMRGRRGVEIELSVASRDTG